MLCCLKFGLHLLHFRFPSLSLTHSLSLSPLYSTLGIFFYFSRLYFPWVSFSLVSVSLYPYDHIYFGISLSCLLFFKVCVFYFCVYLFLILALPSLALFYFFPFWLPLRAALLPRYWLSPPCVSILSILWVSCSLLDRSMAAGLCRLHIAT